MKLNQKYIEKFLRTINIKNCGKVIKQNNNFIFIDCRYINQDPIEKLVSKSFNNYVNIITQSALEAKYNLNSFPIYVSPKTCYDSFHEKSYIEQWLKFQEETKEERNND